VNEHVYSGPPRNRSAIPRGGSFFHSIAWLYDVPYAAVLLRRALPVVEHLGLTDEELADLAMAYEWPESTRHVRNLHRMIENGLIDSDYDKAQLTEKGEELRVQFGLLRGGEP